MLDGEEQDDPFGGAWIEQDFLHLTDINAVVLDGCIQIERDELNKLSLKKSGLMDDLLRARGMQQEGPVGEAKARRVNGIYIGSLNLEVRASPRFAMGK